MIAAFLLLFGIVTGESQAGDSRASQTNLLHEAEAAFREGVKARQDRASAQRWFRKAATHYETLRQQGIRNTDLDRNLGNAHLLAGDLPRGILAYRRGLRLNPGDEALRANLAYARKQVVYLESASPRRPAGDQWIWFPYRAAGLQVVAGLALYTLGWLWITRWCMVRRTWLWGASLAALALAGLLGAGLAMRAWQQRQDLEHPPVVISEDGVYLRRGNGYAYPPRLDTPLNRGMEARFLFRRGEWLQVELGDGEVGWLPLAKLLVDA